LTLEPHKSGLPKQNQNFEGRVQFIVQLHVEKKNVPFLSNN